MSSKSSKRFHFTGYMLLALSASSCSPNAASITKAALLGMEQKRPSVTRTGSAPSVSPSSTPAAASVGSSGEIYLTPRFLDESTFNHQTEHLSSDSSSVVVTFRSLQEFMNFKKSDEGQVTVAGGVDLGKLLSAGGVAYLSLTDPVADSAGLSTGFWIVLKPNSDHSGWEVTTSRDKLDEENLLADLNQLVMTVTRAPQTTPSPSPLPDLSPAAASFDTTDAIFSSIQSSE